MYTFITGTLLLLLLLLLLLWGARGSVVIKALSYRAERCEFEAR
jgi:hypothetical protein